jgi:hypothetical protein
LAMQSEQQCPHILLGLACHLSIFQVNTPSTS